MGRALWSVFTMHKGAAGLSHHFRLVLLVETDGVSERIEAIGPAKVYRRQSRKLSQTLEQRFWTLPTRTKQARFVRLERQHIGQSGSES